MLLPERRGNPGGEEAAEAAAYHGEEEGDREEHGWIGCGDGGIYSGFLRLVTRYMLA